MTRRTWLQTLGSLLALSPLALLLAATGSVAQDGKLTGVPGALSGAAPPGSSLIAGTHATALESFLERSGSLLVERRALLDPIPLQGGTSLRLEPLVVFEPSREAERMLGVRLRFKDPALSGRDALAYLDLHEVDGLIRGIELIPTLLETEPMPPEGEVEVHHETLDGLVVSATRSGAGVRRALRIERADLEVELPIGAAGLTQLAEQLDACRGFLFAQ